MASACAHVAFIPGDLLGELLERRRHRRLGFRLLVIGGRDRLVARKRRDAQSRNDEVDIDDILLLGGLGFELSRPMTHQVVALAGFLVGEPLFVVMNIESGGRAQRDVDGPLGDARGFQQAPRKLAGDVMFLLGDPQRQHRGVADRNVAERDLLHLEIDKGHGRPDGAVLGYEIAGVGLDHPAVRLAREGLDDLHGLVTLHDPLRLRRRAHRAFDQRRRLLVHGFRDGEIGRYPDLRGGHGTQVLRVNRADAAQASG
jgi:hypothetical protein